MDEPIHVLGLTPGKQTALRLILNNFYMLLLYQAFDGISTLSFDMITYRRNQLIRHFEVSSSISDIMSGSGKARNKLVMFSPLAMKHLVTALKVYDMGHNYLTPEERSLVSKELTDLKERVNSSAQYTYTNAEIEKMGVKK